MKNLKGALPPGRDEDESSAAYFLNLGFILLILGMILSVGTILLYFSGLPSSGYTNEEGQVLITPQMFVFLLVMSLVFMGTGLGLIAVARKMGQEEG